MFGPVAEGMELSLGEDYPGFLLAILPPGAFIGLGLLIAIKNSIEKYKSKQTIVVSAPVKAAENSAQ